jgi:hypothetical protein
MHRVCAAGALTLQPGFRVGSRLPRGTSNWIQAARRSGAISMDEQAVVRRSAPIGCVRLSGISFSSVKAWGLRLAGTGGFKEAKLAVARRLAVILAGMWKSNAPFRGRAAASERGRWISTASFLNALLPGRWASIGRFLHCGHRRPRAPLGPIPSSGADMRRPQRSAPERTLSPASASDEGTRLTTASRERQWASPGSPRAHGRDRRIAAELPGMQNTNITQRSFYFEREGGSVIC